MYIALSEKSISLFIFFCDLLTGAFIKNILDHFDFMKKSGILEKKNNDRYRRQVKSIVRNRYEGHLWMNKSKIDILNDEVSKKVKSRVSPNDLADIILEDEQY